MTEWLLTDLHIHTTLSDGTIPAGKSKWLWDYWNQGEELSWRGGEKYLTKTSSSCNITVTKKGYLKKDKWR